MSAVLRSLAKRVLPRSFADGLPRRAWQQLKFCRDRAAFRAAHPTVAYIILSPARIAELRAEGFHSQIGQDFFLHLLFDQPHGRFIDVGANNPQLNSNTLFFEQRGWTGYAFDPLRSLAQRWQTRPGTQFVNAGISDRVETRMFVEILPRAGWEHQLSAFADFVRPEDLRAYESVSYPVECAPIAHFIAGEAPFEFVSIDVEGAEALILAGIDLDLAPPRAILLENASRMGGVEAHRALLARKGYALVARFNASDDLFVHASHALPEQFRAALRAHATP